MIRVSEEYRKQLEEIHTTNLMGMGVEPPGPLNELIFSNRKSIKSILDYGCGPGNMLRTLQKMYPKIKFIGWDPGIPERSYFPEKVDLIYSTDVLEHIEPNELDDTLRVLFNTADMHYHNIACHPAGKTLSDGRNAHLIIENPDWWEKKIKIILGSNWSIEYTNVYHTYKKKRKGTHFEIITKRVSSS